MNKENTILIRQIDQKYYSNVRNYGIDALRILSMLMVVVLHLLGHGGILWANDSIPLVKYIPLTSIQISSYCAVNCYALISGYVGIDSKYKYSNLVFHYLDVLFYTTIVELVFFVFVRTPFSIAELPRIIFPFAYNDYWYFSAYFCMFFFIPFLNKIVNSIDIKLAFVLIITCFLFCSIMPSIFDVDPLNVKDGYTPIWLSCLYLIGALIKKYNVHLSVSCKLAFVLYFCTVFLTAGFTLLSEYIQGRFGVLLYNSYLLLRYNSPTILLEAVFLFIGFARLRINKGKRIIKLLVPSAFSVYIIHRNPHIWDLLKDEFIGFVQYNPVLMVVLVLGVSIAIFLTCIGIDSIRRIVFRLLNVKKMLDEFELIIRDMIYKKAEQRT